VILFVCAGSFKTTRKILEVTVGFFQFRGTVNKIKLQQCAKYNVRQQSTDR